MGSALDRLRRQNLGKEHVTEPTHADDVKREDDHPDDSGDSPPEQAKAREHEMEESGEENAA